MPLDSQASVIEKGVPFPDRPYRKYGPRSPYSKHGKAMLRMDVGDSALVSKIPATPEQVAVFISRYKGPKLFKLRMTEEGHRVWRIA